MASQGQMIVKMPNGQVEVKARRRLQDAAAFEAFVEEIQTTLIQMKESDANATVADFDISQNPTTPEQFEALFNALALAGVRVVRFRLFGCPGLNDEAMTHISNHFSQDLTSETAPTEMHLSDCAITTDGFLMFMSAIEEKEVYPTSILRGKQIPLYMRIENNYIDEAIIQEKVDAGIIRAFKKGPGVRQDTADPGIKINLVVMKEGSYQQKTGDPPAPEDAPPPKPVSDSRGKGASDSRGKGGGSNSHQPWQKGGQSWQQARPPWANNQNQGWWPHAAQALPAGRWPVQPQAGGRVVTPLHGKGAQGGIRIPGRVTGGPRPGAYQQSWTPRGSAGSAVDRSRTPAGRSNGGARPPSGPPPKTNRGGLPHPWEEQWSDDYQIPYFWNSETGESLWERPRA